MLLQQRTEQREDSLPMLLWSCLTHPSVKGRDGGTVRSGSRVHPSLSTAVTVNTISFAALKSFVVRNTLPALSYKT